MHTIGIILLNSAAALVAAGGLYDMFVSRLPKNLQTACGENGDAARLVRELLRALGGSLFAIGVSVALLTNVNFVGGQRFSLWLVLMLVVPAEGINAFSMHRVGSPYYLPLGFIVITVLGVALAQL